MDEKPKPKGLSRMVEVSKFKAKLELQELRDSKDPYLQVV